MSKIPKFKKEEEEVKFWNEHTLDEFDEELEVVEGVKFVKRKKQLVSIRLDPYQIKILKRIASRKGIGYLTLVRMWLSERMNEELKRAS